MNRLQEIMTEQLAQTLEGLSFADVTRAEHGSEELGSARRVRIVSGEPTPLTITLYLPKNLLRRLAAAAMGIEEAELDDESIDDYLCELLNTLAGRYLTALYPGRTYKLGLPQLQPPAQPAADAWHYQADQFPLAVTVVLPEGTTIEE